MTRISRILALTAVVFSLIAATQAVAAPQKTTYSTVDLIAEQSGLPVTGGTVTFGLYIKPDAGWHAYWSNPGDAGKEATVRWSLPAGFKAGDFAFPTPHLLPLGGLNTYGFEESVLLLSVLTVPAGLSSGETIELTGTASWVVCDDAVCVPEHADLSLTMSVGDTAPSADNAELFAKARSKLPESVDWSAEFALVNGRVNFAITSDNVSEGFEDAYLFVESKKLVQYATQTFGFTRGGLSFSMDASKLADSQESTAAIFSYKNADGEAQSVALNIIRTSGSSLAATTVLASDGGLGFVKAVLFAFLGGIILNLMPCVFPILSMKALSLVSMAQANQRVARESGVIYTLGILVAFAAIGAALLALRSAGDAVGWGFQMQNPLINVGIGLLMVLIGLNLFGVFEIGTRVVGVGQGLTEGGERRSAFFTGLLAVVVATPCTAPFMAGALGFALSQPAATAMSVFLALGFGLAFPYLVLSFVPGFGRLMPKPGAWMEAFKHFLAFPMFLTAIWMFWVVGKQLGATSMTVALLAALALAFALWAYGRGAVASRKAAWYTTAAVGMLACLFAFTKVEENKITIRVEGDYSAGTLGGLELEHFDPERVRQYIADGQPTFVYFTADWCVSCKVNERVALATDEVAEAFRSRNIKVIEGDWTTEDPIITEWLEMYDRVGVPLYLYFPRGSTLETVTILPQILLPELLVGSVDQADNDAGVLYAESENVEVPEDEVAYVIPIADPDWSTVQAYIDADEAWHELDREIRDADDNDEEKNRRLEEERGSHPDVEAATAAAAAIARSDGANEKTVDAAKFLVHHPLQSPGQNEALTLGVSMLAKHHAEFEGWPVVLYEMDRFTDPGTDGEIDELFASFPELISGQPLATATARYFAASRQMRLANAVSTPAADRADYRLRAIEFATGLSDGVENEELVRKRRFKDGKPLPFPTLGKSEADLIYNLNYLTVGSVIPDVSALRLDGVEESVSTYRGQAVLLDFWATWCGPCIASLPKLDELVAELPGDEFEILSISVDEYVETVTDFQQNKPMPWANWHIGPKSPILKKWAVRGYPTYILVDHEGTIIARQHDLNDEFKALIRTTACNAADGLAC